VRTINVCHCVHCSEKPAAVKACEAAKKDESSDGLSSEDEMPAAKKAKAAEPAKKDESSDGQLSYDESGDSGKMPSAEKAKAAEPAKKKSTLVMTQNH